MIDWTMWFMGQTVTYFQVWMSVWVIFTIVSVISSTHENTKIVAWLGWLWPIILVASFAVELFKIIMKWAMDCNELRK